MQKVLEFFVVDLDEANPQQILRSCRPSPGIGSAGPAVPSVDLLEDHPDDAWDHTELVLEEV
eukprot:SAG31_NODE_1505_length_8078_cov_5.291390_1_plen_62_part_00